MPDKKQKLPQLVEINDQGETVSSPTAPQPSSLTEIPNDDLEGAVIEQSKPDLSNLSSRISKKESGGDYSATNPSSSAVGKYQFLWNEFGDSIKKVTGVKSQEEFLSNPAAQEKFFQYHVQNNLSPAITRISPYNKAGYDDTQLAMLVHFKGEGGAKQWLQQHKDATKRHNISIDDYVGAPESKQQPATPDDNTPVLNVDVMDPITHLPVQSPVPGKESVNNQTEGAVKFMANDMMDNLGNYHSDDHLNIASIPIHQSGNIIHDVTNPHGNPNLTSSYLHDRIAALDRERAQEIDKAGFNDPSKAAGANPQTLTDINAKYDQHIQQLKSAAGHLVQLQLFNKDYTNKEYTPATAATAKESANAQYQDAIKAANQHFHDKIQGEDKYDTDKAEKEREAEIRSINEEHAKKLNAISSNTKYDDVKLGMDYARLTGDPDAQKVYDKYNAGKPLTPEDKLKYQMLGQQIIKTGAAATVNENVANEANKHVKNAEQIETENQQLFNERRAQQIGNAKYQDENPLFRSIVPHFGDMSPEDVEKYGKQIGLTDGQIKKIDPSSVPTSSTLWQQFAKGALNTAAPIYERAVRSAAAIAGANPEDVNEAFKEGWENQRGPGAAIVGNIPSEQNSFSNVRGALGQIFEGAGGLSTFGGEVAGVGEGLGALGKTQDAAQHLANFGVMAFNGYNNAYHHAAEAIGDKPDDEWKRQGYALLNGLIEGKIFSINPKAALAEKALGITAENEVAASKFLKEFEKAKDPSFFEEPSFEKKIATTISEAAKDNGIQVGLATANEMSKDIINTIVNPEKNQDIPEDIKNAAIGTSLAMMIPSIMGGINHARMQTPLAKSAMFEVGAHPDKYLQDIQARTDAGTITPEDAQKSREAIITMRKIIDNTPTITTGGQPLTPDQIKDYAWDLLREHTLQQQSKDISEAATNAGLTPDQAQLDPLNEMIKEMQADRQKILSGKGAKRIETPQAEKAKEEEKVSEDERSVAPKDEEKAPAEKKEDILPVENEKDITLQSQSESKDDNESHLKTSDNGSNQENDGRQSNASQQEGEDIRENPDVRQAAHSEGRHDQEENRVLVERNPGGNGEPQAEQREQRAAVPVKPKKNRFSKLEKTEPDAIIHSEGQKQEGDQQGGEQEYAPVKPAGREAEAASPEDSDSHIGSEAKEKELVPHPENHYRKVDEAGFQDILESGFIRPRQKKPGEKGTPNEDGVALNKKQFQDVFFAKGKPHEGYKGDYVVETEGIKMVNVGHGNAVGVVPYDEVAKKPIKSLSIEDPRVKIYKKDESGKYIEVDKKELLKKQGESRDVTDINVGDKSPQKKPTEAPTAERSVATEAEKKQAVDNQNETESENVPRETIIEEHKSPLSKAVDNFNKYKDAVVKKEAAIQKLRDEGKEKGDPDFDKKFAELELAKKKKIEAFKEYEKEFRKDQQHANHKLSTSIRKGSKKFAEEFTKSRIEGQKAGFGIPKETIEWLGNRVADLVKAGENLHLAIRRAIAERKELTPEQQEKLKKSLQEGEHVTAYRDELKHEPPFLAHKEDHDIAVGLIKDIKAGNDTIEAVMDDLHEANISPERKKIIADFIDREINLTSEQKENAKQEYNSQTLREPSYEKTYLNDYKLSGSGELSRYISGERLEDVFGDEIQFDKDSKEKLLLNNVVTDTSNMVGLAKFHAGTDDILKWGSDMLSNIEKIPDGESVKKILGVAGLINELHGERIRMENEMPEASKERKDEIANRLKEIKKMTGKTELLYRNIASKASETLNAARVNRIYRNTYFAEEYASRILSDQERKAKEALEGALETTKISDKDAEQATSIPEAMAAKEIDKTIEEKNKSEAGKNVESTLSKDKSSEKGKKVIDRMKKKKKPDAPTKNTIDQLEKSAQERMGGKSPKEFLEQLKEKIKKKKC